MPTSIDSLQIEINASAQKANNEIDKLSAKLDKLSKGISSINPAPITGLANGIQKLGISMQTVSTVKTADFTRVTNGIAKLGSINVSAINSAASSMSHLTRAFNSLGTVSQNAQQVGEMAKNLSKLGNKGVQNAITNIPQLATAMNQLMTTLSRSPRVSQNVINMTNALANLASQGRNIGAATNALTSGLNRSSNAMQKSTKSAWSLASAFGRFYASYFLVIRGIKKLWSSIEGTADYIEAFNYYNVAFGKIASEWDKNWEKYGYENAESYANSFTERMSKSLGKLSGIQIDVESGLLSDTGMKNLGLNIQEITQYASQLASVTNSVGQTGEVSLAAANAFTKLGADISSLFNQDYSSVMGNLQSGLIGQSRALYKYGIDITNATLQTYAYELGLTKAVSEMTQAEKMQLRMIAILDQSKVSWGDLANTINSPSNMIRQFTNNLKECGMVLGQLFIPLLQKVLPIINGVTIAIKRLLANIAGFLGIQIDLSGFGQGYTDLGDSLDDVAGAYDDATGAAKKFKSTTLGIDELNINNPNTDSGSGSVGGGSIDLTDEILAATEEYEKVWNAAFENMESKAQAFADKISNLLKPISDMFKNLFSGNFELAGGNLSEFFMQLMDINWDSVYEKARGFGTGLAQFLNGLISPELFGKVGSTIAGSLNTAIQSALAFGKTFDFNNFGVSLGTGVNEFFNTFNFDALADSLNTWIDGLEDAIAGFLKTVKWSNILSKVGKFLGDLELDTIGVIAGAILIKKIGVVKLGSMALDLLSKSIGTSISTAIANAGGLSGLLTLDMAALVGETGWATAGLLAGGAIIGGIVAAFAGWNFGQWLNEQITGEEIDMTFSEQMGEIFSSFTDGSWKDALELWGKDISDGLSAIGEDVNQWLEDTFGDWAGTTFSDVGSSIASWWNDHIAPWFTKEKWSELWNNVKSSFSEKWGEIKEWWASSALVKLWEEDISPWFTVEKWSELWENIKTAFATKWEELKVWWQESTLLLWWEEDIAPWFTVEQWSTLWENIKSAFSTKWEELKEWWNTSTLVLWWKNDIAPWFTLKQWSDLWINVKKAFTDKWEELKKWWQDSTLVKWWKEDVEPWFTKKQWEDGMKGVKEAFDSVWNSAISSIKQIWNKFASWLNEKLTWTINPIVIAGTTIFDGATISLGKIPTFETGGFPEDGLFWANHNELVGQFSNGRTAVANNEQIIEGIKQGVYEAVTSANQSNNQEVMLLQELISAVREGKTIEIDGRELVSAINERTERNGFAFSG